MPKSKSGVARGTALVAVLLALLGVLGGVFASAASAFDGRVPDARPATIEGELTALYNHGLNRDPDPPSWQNYIGWPHEDCQWGLLDDSYRILTSGEAQNTWRHDPQTLAGMLYAALLNRPPDPGGLAAYTGGIRTRGLEWSTASMEASPEYSLRLVNICKGRKSSNAMMYTSEQADQLVDQLIHTSAANLAKVCGGVKLVEQVNKLKKIGTPVTQFVGWTAQITNLIGGRLGVNDSCKATVTILRVAYRVNELASYGDQNNPVFAEWDMHRVGSFIHRQTAFTFRIGPDPTHWDAFSGKY
jgi:hypothetical protein